MFGGLRVSHLMVRIKLCADSAPVFQEDDIEEWLCETALSDPHLKFQEL